MSLIHPKGRRYNSRKVAKIYRKYPFLPPPPLRRATEIPSGGGVQKEAISEGVGVAYRGFLPGGLSKIGELLINNSFSVEHCYQLFYCLASVSYGALLGSKLIMQTFFKMTFELQARVKTEKKKSNSL